MRLRQVALGETKTAPGFPGAVGIEKRHHVQNRRARETTAPVG